MFNADNFNVPNYDAEKSLNDDADHILYIKSGNRSWEQESNWPVVKEYKSTLTEVNIDLTGGSRGDLLTEYAKEIASVVQFPPSTTFLHGLGVVCTAMTKSFYVDYRGKFKPVTIYVVTGQPPSTGKSAVNEFFSDPVSEAFMDLNERTSIKRRLLIRECAAKLKEAEKADESDAYEKESEYLRAKKELAKIPEYVYSLDDPTIEGAEMVASKQGGTFNIVSAEAEAIEVVTGNVYANENASAKNFNLLLKAWDGEVASVARASREGYNGVIKASIAVLAQPKSVDTIIKLGALGRGISGRFLVLNEVDLLGKRKSSLKNGRYKKVDQGLKDAYKSMIDEVVKEDCVRLELTDLSWCQVDYIFQSVEKDLGMGGKYENRMLTEFAGKADKHIIKIASVLHVSQEWSPKGKKNFLISDDTVGRAINIFKRLLETYISVADKLGHTGINYEFESVINRIESYASKNKSKMKVSLFCDNIKNSSPFQGTPHIRERMNTILLPKLQELNYCYIHNSIIYFNPRLK